MEDDIEMINLEVVEDMAEKMLIDDFEKDDNYGEGEENVMEISPMQLETICM